MIQSYLISLLISTGLTLGLGFHAGVLGWRVKDQAQYRTLTLIALAEALYFICLYFYIHETNPEDALRWILSVCVFLPSVTFLFGELTFGLLENRSPGLSNLQKCNFVFSILFSGAALLDLVLGTHFVSTGKVFTNTGSLSIHRLEISTFQKVYLVWITLVFYSFSWQIFKYSKGRKSEIYPLLIGIVIYSCTATNDFFILYNFYDFYYLQHFGFMLLVLGFSWSFSERYRKSRELLQYSLKQIESHQAALVQNEKLKSLGVMAAGVAHEINNPIGIVQLQLEKMQIQIGNHPELVDQTNDAFDKMHRNIDRVAKIVSGLKLFSRDSRQDETQRSEIQKIVHESIELLQEKLKTHSVSVRTKGATSPIFIACRPSEVAQVILNLIQNSLDAIQHMPEKWIELEFSSDNDFAQVTVTDCGLGIPPDIAARLLEPFFTTKEVGKGTGLGLSICSGILRSHGGALDYNANCPNTCFVMRVPLWKGVASKPISAETALSY